MNVIEDLLPQPYTYAVKFEAAGLHQEYVEEAVPETVLEHR